MNKAQLILIFLIAALFYKQLFGQNISSGIFSINNLTVDKGVAGKQVYCGLLDSKGFIWFGTSKGLQRFDGKRFRRFNKENNSLQDNKLMNIAEDKNQMLWILYGSKDSISINAGKVDMLDLNSYKLITLKEKFGSQLPFHEQNVVHICNNEKMELMIITSVAKNKCDVFINSTGNEFRKIVSGINIDYPQRLIFRSNKLLFSDSNQTGIIADGKYFASTYSVKAAGNKFSRPLFTQLKPDGETQEPSQQFFNKAVHYDNSQVYFQSLYDSKTGNILIYQPSKGLYFFSGEQYFELAGASELKKFKDLEIYSYFTVSGQHWVCTSQGIIIINHKPGPVVPIHSLPGENATIDAPLRIISFYRFNSKNGVLVDETEEILQTNTIRLLPKDKFFRLDFQLLDFNTGIGHYAYKIEGYDKDWNIIDENFIRISGLPVGEYHLRIRGQNPQGAWSKHELNIPVLVMAPLFDKWWFRFSLLVMFVMLAFAFIRLRVYEITKSKKALEETVKERTRQINTSLAEKEILLKEVHHRVKNNLQVISSLLELQEKKSNNDEVRIVLAEGRNRLRSIALIHQELYQFENLSEIEFRHFLQGLCKQVSELFKKEKQSVKIINEMPQTKLDIDTAVPLGLILNELLTNSYKYAFNDIAEGMIKIQMKQLNQVQFELTYTDNGSGLPENYDLQNSHSLGMQLINDLSRQIGGSIKYEYDYGSKYVVLFSSTKYRKNQD